MDAFGALADPVRRAILAELAAGSRRVVDLADSRPISRPAVSKHLRLLLEAGVVSVAERGRERYYAVDPAGLGGVRDYLDSVVSGAHAAPISPPALDALETEVRRTTRDRRSSVARAPATTSTQETA